MNQFIMSAGGEWVVVDRSTKRAKKGAVGKTWPTVVPENKKLKEVRMEKKREWAAEQRRLKPQLVNVDQCTWSYQDKKGAHHIIGDDTSLPTLPLRFIGGVDISFIKNNEVDACASFVVLSVPSMAIVYQKLKMVQLTEPYIPSFLAFRECPPLVSLVEESLADNRCPLVDILLIDGNGELHTRGYGAACHFGCLLDLPTIGVAKEYFMIKDLSYTKTSVTEAAKLQNKKKGDYLALSGFSGKMWAAALQSHHTSFDPIFVSVGHKVSLSTAISIVSLCCTSDREPEPIRIADRGSRQYLVKKGFNKRKRY